MTADAEDLRKQLELEMEWRQQEIRLLHNQLSNITNEDDKKCYCKSLIVMLYSHFEGFFKAALEVYIDKINKKNYKCSTVNNYLAAASLTDIFKAVNDSSKPCTFFSVTHHNSKLNTYCRHIYFLNEMNKLLDQPVNLATNIIDTESNLKTHIMGKILFRLGFPYETFDSYNEDITNLVLRRQDYAHGEKQEGIDEEKYNKFEVAVFKLMDELTNLLENSLKERTYLREYN